MPRIILCCVCLFLLAIPRADSKESTTGARRATETSTRLREGSKVSDVVGRMELAGDRTTFTPAEAGEAYRLLENLALERINQILSDNRDKSTWEVSGVITEFRGSNFLLVTKAVIKSGTPTNNSLPAKAVSGER